MKTRSKSIHLKMQMSTHQTIPVIK